jgi:hypothetical protein
MDSVHPGRLRPWVRFRTPHGLVEARPDDSVPVSEWADILWNYVVRGWLTDLELRVTACRKLPQSEFWMGWRGERTCCEVPIEPVAAQLARGASAGNYWGWRAGRGLWPLGLLYEMALVNERTELLEPVPNQPAWTGGLAAVAAQWFGVRSGTIVWNSLCLSENALARELRWKLAIVHGICPPGCAPQRLEFMDAVLSRARPEHLPHWSLLLSVEIKTQSAQETLWSSPVSSAQLNEWARCPDQAVIRVLEEAPERLQEFLESRVVLKEVEESDTAELFLKKPEFAARMQILQALSELEHGRFSRQILQAKGELGNAARAWFQGYWVVPLKAAKALELEPRQLGWLMHLRKLNQRPAAWPKTVRRFLQRSESPRSPGHQLRQLLKVKQNFEQTVRQEEQEAWGRLVSEFLGRWLCRLFGLSAPPPADLRQAAWLLACPQIGMANLGHLLSGKPKLELPLNQAWLARLAPQRLRQEIWLAGLERSLEWRGRRYRAYTADSAQALRMGTEFGTCLTLPDGMFNSSLLVNCLDVNKQVLYLSDERGQVLLRQLVAIDQAGRMVCYPIYSHDRSPDLLEKWRNVVRVYAKECDLEVGGSGDQVTILHSPKEDYYSDRRDPEVGAERFEEDYCRGPERLDEDCEWYLARELNHIRAGHCEILELPYLRVEEMLGALGETAWFNRLKEPLIAARFLRCLDYRADPAPIVKLVRRSPKRRRLKSIPVALVALSFAELVDVLDGLVAQELWPKSGLALQALVLLFLAWRKKPDRARLWRHLRRSWRLQPILWSLCALQPEPIFGVLIRRVPASYPYTWALAAAPRIAHWARRRARDQPYLLWSAVLAYAGASGGSVADLHAPTHAQRALLCDIQGDSPDDLAWSLSRQSFECLVQGLSGDQAALERWVFRCAPKQRSWRLELVARLRCEGDLSLAGDVLQTWLFRVDCGDSWLARDFGLGWHGLSTQEVAVGLMRSPAATLDYIEKMESGERACLIAELIWWTHPDQWGALMNWRPDPTQVSAEQLRQAWRRSGECRRLREWLQSWSKDPRLPDLDSSATLSGSRTPPHDTLRGAEKGMT